jgi:cell division septum initiation protein DivIVA
VTEPRNDTASRLGAIEAHIATLSKDLAELRRAVTDLTASNAKLATAVEGRSARLDAQIERASNDVQTLFGLDGKNSERIGKIEKDYTPKDDFNAHVTTNREDHETLRAAVVELKVSVTRIMTYVAIGTMVANGAISLVAKWLG